MIEKIVDYKVATSMDIELFETIVNNFINTGYKPLGGIFYNSISFYQAMVKYESTSQETILS